MAKVLFGLVSILSSGLLLAGPLIPSQAELEEIGNRSSGFSNYSQEQKTGLFIELKHAFQIYIGTKANQVFKDYLDREWDSKYSINEKRKIMNEAMKLAEKAGEEASRELMHRKVNAKLATAKQILSYTMSLDLVNIRYWEEERFLTPEGKVNLKSPSLGGDLMLPETNRPESDPLRWADLQFRGSPQERFENARLAEVKRKEAEVSCASCSKEPPISLHGCGTPTSEAAALRPELNGR